MKASGSSPSKQTTLPVKTGEQNDDESVEQRGRSPTRSASPNKGGQRRNSLSPSKSPNKFSESDFERKRDVVDPETRKKQMMKARGLKLEPKDWTKAELLNKISEFARFNQDKKTNVGELKFIENSQISSEEVKMIDELFRRVTEIQVIIIHHCHLTDEMLQKLLGNYFKQLRFVRVLSLCHNTLSQATIDLLIDSFSRRHRFRLEELDLRGNVGLKYEDGLKAVRSFTYLKLLNGIPVRDILQTHMMIAQAEEKSADDIAREEEEAKAKEEEDAKREAEAKKKEKELAEKKAQEAKKRSIATGGRGGPTKSPEKRRGKEEEEDLLKVLEIPSLPAKKPFGNRHVHIGSGGPIINPYVTTWKNTLTLPKHDIRAVEMGIVIGILEQIHQRVRHIDLSNNQINANSFYYLMHFIRHHNTICSLNISYNPITNKGADLTVVESLLKYVQRKTKLTFLNLEGTDVPQTLLDSIELSMQVNRSLVYSTTNHYRFNEFLERKIRMTAKPTHIPPKFQNPNCRYDYDPMRFMKTEIGTLGGQEGLIVPPTIVAGSIAGMDNEDMMKGLEEEADEEFILKNQLPVCDVELADKGFRILWHDPAHEARLAAQRERNASLRSQVNAMMGAFTAKSNMAKPNTKLKKGISFDEIDGK